MGRYRALQELRRERREQKRIGGAVKFTVTGAEVSGKLVIEAKNVSKALGGRTLIRDLSLRIARGDRLGIVGPNGAGKTTLLDMLTGAGAPDSGTVRLGSNLEIALARPAPCEPRPGHLLEGGADAHRRRQCLSSVASRATSSAT